MTPKVPFSFPLALAGLIAFTVAPLVAAPPDPAEVAFFESKIRPVLVQHCYSCHSADARANKKLRGGLLLDSRDGLLQGGDSGPALVPGKPADSLLLASLRYDGDVKMPPRQKLPDAVIADFETWIRRGAADPRGGKATRVRGLTLEEGRRFWSYQPVGHPSVPVVKDRGRVRNDLDAFIAARLEQRGLRPAAEADRATLIRRLSFDLIGLPPTPEEIDAFVADTRPDAYERIVDRLLDSPAYGERWGRHWLDVARYAESVTLRGLVFKEAWRYRDYVIDSFNRDVPFDRFLREQVAGDLLPAATLEQRRRQVIATAYLAMGNTNLEEQDKKQLRMDVVDEQLETIGKGILGQTLGCARCHDHKFDPVPTKDYYALAGILRNTRTLTHANVSQWIDVSLPADPQREQQLQAHETALAALRERVRSLKAAVAKKGKPADPRRPQVRAVADLPGIVVDDRQAKKVGAWTESKYSGAYVGAGYVHDAAAGKGEKTLTFQPAIPRSGRYEVRLAYAPGTNRAKRVPVTIFSADGEKTVYVDQSQPPAIDGLFHSLGEYRFERSSQGFVLIATEETSGHVIADAVAFLAVDRSAEQTADAGRARPNPEAVAAARETEQLRDLERQVKTMTDGSPRREMALSVVEEKAIEETRVHIRGLVHNLGEKTPRGFLQVATTGRAVTFPGNESGRRQLADWLASADNPLTARVLVNRVWHWLFGAGLVRTTDNFGTTGELPSHPELLDHLARRFVAGGWSVKKLVREIVLSHTYRQSSTGDERARAVDPENRLLAQANRRRLEAECIRDTLLAVSGQLAVDHGGPTFAAAPASDYNYRHTDTRRSVYSPVFRNALPELFEMFDFADPSVATGRRNVSTVVPQALYLMNHPFVLEQARQAARRLLAAPQADDAARLERACRLAFGRAPLDSERQALASHLRRTSPADREGAWAQVFQVLFASLDFRYVD